MNIKVILTPSEGLLNLWLYKASTNKNCVALTLFSEIKVWTKLCDLTVLRWYPSVHVWPGYWLRAFTPWFWGIQKGLARFRGVQNSVARFRGVQNSVSPFYPRTETDRQWAQIYLHKQTRTLSWDNSDNTVCFGGFWMIKRL